MADIVLTAARRIRPQSVRRALALVFSCGVTCFSMAANTGLDAAATLEGQYAARNVECSVPEGRNQVPCDPGTEDCLLLKKVDPRHLKFHVHSTQRNGIQCEVEGVAARSGDSWIYSETDRSTRDFGKGFSMTVRNGRLVFQYLEEPDPAVHLPSFCGAQAQIDRIEFALASKQPSYRGMICGNSVGF